MKPFTMIDIRDGGYYEVQITVIGPRGASEVTFPTVSDVFVRSENSARGHDFTVAFTAEDPEKRGYVMFQKDLNIASRCTCYEKSLQEESEINFLDILRRRNEEITRAIDEHDGFCVVDGDVIRDFDTREQIYPRKFNFGKD